MMQRVSWWYSPKEGTFVCSKVCFFFRHYSGKITVGTLLRHCGLWSRHSVFEALLDEVEFVAQRLIAIRHTDLGHVGLADVVALRTLLQVVSTQEVLLLLANRSIWAESIPCAT